MGSQRLQHKLVTEQQLWRFPYPSGWLPRGPESSELKELDSAELSSPYLIRPPILHRDTKVTKAGDSLGSNSSRGKPTLQSSPQSHEAAEEWNPRQNQRSSAKGRQPHGTQQPRWGGRRFTGWAASSDSSVPDLIDLQSTWKSAWAQLTRQNKLFATEKGPAREVTEALFMERKARNNLSAQL